ncbi:terminase TerL endonuclease subunit, partial [Arthrospira platensis SPKY1]|nr:terminase TerL endonuclease subunit [Arthrospira platensis SPKY1]
FDRFKATHGVIQHLMDEGINCMEFGQGFISMDHPCQELYKLAYQNRLHHGGNPILRWMAGNVVIKMNESGLIKMDKMRSKDKIDGMVALAMALGVALMPEEQNEESIYLKIAREQLRAGG